MTYRSLLALCVVMATPIVQAEADIFAEYRAMFGDDNPAELVEMQGESLWSEVRGPRQASLAQCDLGLGAGVLDGAYAQLPRYFKDVDRVMDLETRLVHCMVTLQGLTSEEASQKPFSDQGEQQTDLEMLATYVSARSKGSILKAPQAHPKEREAFALGQEVFHYRGGPYDFSCATRHAAPDKRIRLQSLPDLTKAEGAQKAFSTWPGYRISQGAVRTMQWRMNDCFRQQRMPNLVYGSDVSIALITYMAVMGEGAEMATPGLKR